MHRTKLFLRTAALLAFAACPLALAAADNRGVSSGRASLAIEGVFAGSILQKEGGEPWASVITQSSPSGSLGKRHVANIQYSPLTLEIDFPPMAPVVAWINDLCAGRPSAKNISVTSYNDGGRALDTMDFLSSRLIEVRFPALDASSSATARITLVVYPEQVRAGTVAVSGSGGKRGFPVNNFALSIGRILSGDAVTKIDGLTIKSSVSTDTVGNFREPTRSQGPVTASNLVLTINDSQAADWKAWRDSFLIQGHHLEADEQDGFITFGEKRPGDASRVSLNFSHLGLVRLVQIPKSSSENLLRDQVELYFEGLTLTGPNTPGTTTSTALPAQPPAGNQSAPADTSAAAATPTPAEATATTAAPADQGKKTTRAAAIEQAPLSTAPSAQAAGSTAVRTVEANPPAATPAAGGSDAGPRDPADFPRFGETVRTAYSANTGKVQSDESATYTTNAGFDQVVAFYNGQPKSAGWEELNRSETSRSSSGRTMIIDWRKPQKTAQVRLNPLKNGGTEIWVTVTTQKSAK